jgi:hypothetical protein
MYLLAFAAAAAATACLKCTSLYGPTNRLVTVESGIFTSLARAHDITVDFHFLHVSIVFALTLTLTFFDWRNFPSFRSKLYLHDPDLRCPFQLCPSLRRK